MPRDAFHPSGFYESEINDRGEVVSDWLSPADQRHSRDLTDHLEYLIVYAPAAHVESQTRRETSSVNRPWRLNIDGLFRMTLYRERLLYQDLRGIGVTLPNLLRPDEVESDHEEELFSALESRGVFERTWTSFNPLENHREMFRVMREGGFVWDLERDTWTGFRKGRDNWGYIRVD